ncbi:hypothetical protein K1Y38_01325 [Serratia marcescens]|nr:hypothetical protein [Serratia marcescens]
MTQENGQYMVRREGITYGNIKDGVFIDKDGGVRPIVNNVFSSEKTGLVMPGGVVKPKPTSTFVVDITQKTVTRDDGTIFDLVQVD